MTETTMAQARAGSSLRRRRTAGPVGAAVAAMVLSVLPAAAPAHAVPLSVSQFGQLALQCGATVAPLTLAAVARTESRFEPLAIHDNTTGVTGVPATPEIATQLATELLEAGHSVDLGLMQINSANFSRLGLDARAAFDPCRSVGAAATILTGDYAGGDTHAAQQAALRGALSSYNTGDPVRGVENGYVQKVQLAARQVVPAIDLPDPAPSAAAPEPSPGPAAVAPPPADPNAPPAWNVWASFDYAVSGHSAAPTSDAGAAVLAAAGNAPTPTALDLIPTDTGAP